MAENKPLPINWDWQTPIDGWETWDPAEVDGRSDVNNMALSSSAEVGDLEIVTLMMYMPSGDIPYLRLGVGWAPSFVDQTDQWTELPGFSANDCYIQSWWRVATAESVAVGTVYVNLYNFDAPLDPDGGSSEGGNVFINVIRTDEEPTIAYQQGSTEDTFTTPNPDPDTVLHFFFARRLNSDTDSIHTVVIREPSQPGLEAIPAGGFTYSGHQWMTQILEDAEYYTGEWWLDKDKYTLGFYYSNGSPGTEDFKYTGSIMWDLSTSEDSGFGYTLIPFGAAGAIAQGIKVKTGDEAPIITFI